MAKKYWVGKIHSEPFFCRNGQVETVLCFLDDDVWGRSCFFMFFFHFLVKVWSGVANRLQCVHSNRMQPWQKAFFRRKKRIRLNRPWQWSVQMLDAGSILRLRLKERRELGWYGMMGIWCLWVFHIWLLDLWSSWLPRESRLWHVLSPPWKVITISPATMKLRRISMAHHDTTWCFVLHLQFLETKTSPPWRVLVWYSTPKSKSLRIFREVMERPTFLGHFLES